MYKFTTGLIAGGLIGAAGLTLAMSDRKARKKISKEGKQMMRKANSLMNKMDW